MTWNKIYFLILVRHFAIFYTVIRSQHLNIGWKKIFFYCLYNNNWENVFSKNEKLSNARSCMSSKAWSCDRRYFLWEQKWKIKKTVIFHNKRRVYTNFISNTRLEIYPSRPRLPRSKFHSPFCSFSRNFGV